MNLLLTLANKYISTHLGDVSRSAQTLNWGKSLALAGDATNSPELESNLID